MKIKFIKNQFFILTVSAAFARNKIYKTGTSEKEKIRFRKSIETLLNSLGDSYKKKKVSGVEHLRNLTELKSKIEVQNKGILEASELTFGTVQKLLNLYLKYLWAIGLIHEPPHCPIDRIILYAIGDYKTSWTRMDKQKYCQIIEKIRSIITNGSSIAEWELGEYNKR